MTVYKELVKKIPIAPEKKTKQKDYLDKGKLAIVDQGQKLIGGYSNDDSLMVACDLPVVVFGDHTRAVKFIIFPFGAGADGIKVLQPRQCILPKFLFYITQYLVLNLEDKGYARHYQYLEKKEVDLPTLPEQERIVACIDELFSQLDSSVETLKKAKQQLTVYRQVVLKETFDIGAEIVEIRELLDTIRIGPFGTALHKNDYITGGIPVINPQHIKNLTIKPNRNTTITADKAKELSAYKLQCNDIVLGRRGDMGRAAAVTNKEQGFICGTGSILLRMKPSYDATLYARILSSPSSVHYLEEHATGTTMKNLNEDIVKQIPVPKITREMQQVISKKLDEKLTTCDYIAQTIDTVLQQTEALRQSILKKAFERNL